MVGPLFIFQHKDILNVQLSSKKNALLPYTSIIHATLIQTAKMLGRDIVLNPVVKCIVVKAKILSVYCFTRLVPVFIFPFLMSAPDRVFQSEPGERLKGKMIKTKSYPTSFCGI